jgi:peroxiredoxin
MLYGHDVGSIFPDVELPDQDGVLQRLSAIQGPDPMVLILGRSEHCLRERQYHRDMLQVHDWIRAARFSSIVTILPDTVEELGRMRTTTGASWPFLSDKALELQQLLRIRDPFYERDSTVPHILILAPGLVIDKVYVGSWYWGRASAHDIFSDLRDLTMRIRPDFDPTLA